MSIRIIHEALDLHLGSVIGLPELFTENEEGHLQSYAEVSARRASYCRSTMLPLETEPLTVGRHGWDSFEGLYQIDIFSPRGDGTAGNEYQIDEILKKFQSGTHIRKDGVTVRVVNYFPEAGDTNTNYYQSIVTIRYQAIIQREYTYNVVDYS